MTEPPLEADLRAALAAVARVPRLLVASDVDGTLAPIVEDPAAAVAGPAALSALAALATLPDTSVALVSGRRLVDLREMTRLGTAVVLVGSHGAEHGEDLELTPGTALVLEQVLRDVRWITHGITGVQLENKPGGVAVHVRRATHVDAHRVVADIVEGPATRPGVHTTHGKAVVELSVVDADKGRALDRLRTESSADAVVFLGDDTTDEAAFERLGPGDVGVKIGDGESLARFRVDSTADATAVLELLLAERRAARAETSP